jgi:type IV pilus assembly protein PilC
MSSISTRSLIQLCHRVGTAVRSGVDARRVWELEERHATGPLKEALSTIKRQVTAGGTVAEGMQASNGYFPPMFVQMVAVGEQTGKLDEVMRRLAEHYEHLSSMRRLFWLGIAWPLFSLVFGVVILGLVIYITGAIAASRGTEPVDLLGLGLSGASGAIIWFCMWGFAAAAIAIFCYAVFRGLLGPGPVLIAMRIPILGKCLESLALARLTWSLAVALESGMDAGRAASMSIMAAQNPYYETAHARVASAIRANRQFHESFADAGVFPSDFIGQVEVAEEAGATNEALLRLSKEYEDRARTAMKILTGLAVGGVMLTYFALFALAIFSLAYSALIKPTQDILNDINSGRL